MDKRFAGFWGEGYGRESLAQQEALNEDFFDIDSGYEKEDIEAIRALRVGEAYNMVDGVTGAVHSVVRLS